MREGSEPEISGRAGRSRRGRRRRRRGCGGAAGMREGSKPERMNGWCGGLGF
ncbi:hypothetical protein U9M48_022925 [Paspalum notatum var. saurae]|uniref:Uncharacterized protein n=1 Tax=Paspalum notatum var. saurae TaxID=547442 RepID=A0AAQ3TIP0_PASNO